MSEAEPLCVFFAMGPTEMSDRPAIYMDNPTGGDPLIIAIIKRVYLEDKLHEALGQTNRYRRVALPAPPVSNDATHALSTALAYMVNALHDLRTGSDPVRAAATLSEGMAAVEAGMAGSGV